MLLTPPRDECLLAFKQHGPAIAELQHFLLDSITTNRSSLNLSPHEMAHFAELILDKGETFPHKTVYLQLIHMGPV